jgi:hypothetical protein
MITPLRGAGFASGASLAAPAAAGSAAAGPGPAKGYAKIRFPDARTLLALRAVRACLSSLEAPGTAAPAVPLLPGLDLIVTVDAEHSSSRRRFDASRADPHQRANATTYLSGMLNAPAASVAIELGLEGRTLTLCHYGAGEREAFATAESWLRRGVSAHVLVVCVHGAHDPAAAHACCLLAGPMGRPNLRAEIDAVPPAGVRGLAQRVFGLGQ